MNLKLNRFFCFLAALYLCFAVSCKTYTEGNTNLPGGNNEAAKKQEDDTGSGTQENAEIIIDSSLSLTEAIGEPKISGENLKEFNAIKEKLVLVDVQYYSFDGKLHQGQIVVNNSLKEDIGDIFREIKENKFPVAKVIPVSRYNFSDDESMTANNTSSFNYRPIKGTKTPSNHSFGKAIDVNPFLNPQIRNGITEPKGAEYDLTKPGTISGDGVVVNAFKKRGWTWGGDWTTLKDYQHFEKVNAQN